MKAIRLQGSLKRVVGSESGRRNCIDLREGRELGVEGTRCLLASRVTQAGAEIAAWPEACSQRRLVDIEQLELVNAMVADITDLKDDFVREFLLNIEIPLLHIRRFQVVLNTRDV